METFRKVVTGIVVGLSIGFIAGIYAEHKFQQADLVRQATQDRTDTANNIVDSLNESNKIESKVADIKDSNEQMRKLAATHAKETSHENSGTCRYIDRATVWLLDSSRNGSLVSPAFSSNEEGAAASDVEVSEFVDNDIKVVGMYHNLAERHDALVEYVEQLLNKQANK